MRIELEFAGNEDAAVGARPNHNNVDRSTAHRTFSPHTDPSTVIDRRADWMTPADGLRHPLSPSSSLPTSRPLD
jgi:hypothetical protein